MHIGILDIFVLVGGDLPRIVTVTAQSVGERLERAAALVFTDITESCAAALRFFHTIDTHPVKNPVSRALTHTRRWVIKSASEYFVSTIFFSFAFHFQQC